MANLVWMFANSDQIGLPLVGVNKVLLAHNQAQLFAHQLWLLSGSNGRDNVVTTETIWPAELKMISSRPLIGSLCSSQDIMRCV